MKEHGLLVLGGLSFALAEALLYGLVCPDMIVAANSNPFLYSDRVIHGLHLHLALVSLLIVLPPLLMAPYRVYALGGGAEKLRALLGWEALSLYLPSALAVGLVALVYRLYSGSLAREFLHMVSFMALVFSALTVYASVLAVPWATAKALVGEAPSKKWLVLIGAASIVAAKLAATMVALLVRLAYNPVVWRCSAESLGVAVVNSKTSVLEKLYTVDVSQVLSTLTAAILYYYILVRMLGRR